MELLVGWLLAPRDRCWSAGEEGEAPVGPGGARDGVGGVKVLGDELARLAAADLHSHAVRLLHLVVACRRRRRLPH